MAATTAILPPKTLTSYGVDAKPHPDTLFVQHSGQIRDGILGIGDSQAIAGYNNDGLGLSKGLHCTCSINLLVCFYFLYCFGIFSSSLLLVAAQNDVGQATVHRLCKKGMVESGIVDSNAS